MNIPGPDAIREALERYVWREMPPLPGRTNHLHAGVLIPLLWDPFPVAIVTQRASQLRTHAGEVCFPGGRPDPADADLLSTALREAREELGIDRANVLGRLSSMPLYTSDYRLVPFVAEIPADPLRPDPGEVAHVFRLSLLEELERPFIEALPWDDRGTIHYAPLFRPGGELMYGATAYTFYELLQVLAPVFGRPLPPMRASDVTWQDIFSRATAAQARVGTR